MDSNKLLEIIDSLESRALLDLCRCLLCASSYPQPMSKVCLEDYDFEYCDFWAIDWEFVEYCDNLDSLGKLQLAQTILNTLVSEAKQAQIIHTQLKLPLAG
jgi:hypothetical protein